MTRRLKGTDAAVPAAKPLGAGAAQPTRRPHAAVRSEPSTVTKPPESTWTAAQAPAVASTAAVGRATAEDLRAVADVCARAYESAQTVLGNRAWGDVKAQLTRIQAMDEGKPRREITIVGAGISGLVAAYELEKLGHRVRIIDAGDRVGGRVETKRFPDGTYHEKGAMRIPRSHDYIRYYVDEMGLKLQKFTSANPDAYLELDGKKTRFKDAQAEGAARGARAPAQIVAALMQGLLKSLTPKERASIYETQLSSKRLQDLDKLSFEDFLRQHEDADTVKLIGDATTLRGQFDRSVMFFLRQELRGNSEGLEEIVGGMDRLPTEVARRIHGPIELGTKLLGVRNLEGGKVELTFQHGNQTRKELVNEALVTLPFTVMRGVETPDFSAGKMNAIHNLSYGDATKVILDVAEEFWRTRDQIDGGASHSDGASGATYYPQNHVMPGSEAAKARPDERPAALLGSYVWGEDARRLDAMTEEERVQTVIDSIAQFHPAIKEPGMVKGHAVADWKDNPLTQGAFAQPLPGQNGLYKEALKPEGFVHFAGEHTSLDHGWIQGAIISALRAVEEIVTSPLPAAEAEAAKGGVRP